MITVPWCTPRRACSSTTTCRGGAWDELALWFGTPAAHGNMSLPRYVGDQLYGKSSWAYLRTAQFNSRPSHADQLHLDLWWRGLNVTRDAGTYLYNADSPWDNSLTPAWVHNTVTVNGKDQFTRAGRFLYLDWFNAYRVSLPQDDPAVLQRVRGRTRGGGCRHTRIVSVREDDRWLVEDEILPLRMPWDKKPRTFRLHWLLPDWKWSIENHGAEILLRLESPHGPVTLAVTTCSSRRAADIFTRPRRRTAGGCGFARRHARLGLAQLRDQAPGIVTGGRN